MPDTAGLDDNAPLKLFEKAAKIYPRRVAGRYRNLKWLAMIVLLGIYYGAPWLRWDRGPHVPGQAILIDLVGQRGYFFGIEIWPQEVYLLVGVLILAAVGLFFATTLLGRVWCGYACPQTVWTDLFVWVERFVQGDRNARKRLDEAPWGLEKVGKKGLTHLIWLVIGALTGGAWVFYFNDAPSLMSDLIHFDASWTVLGWIIALTLSTYFMAGFARENVCTYMCPYARFQSAMFDKESLIIAYEPDRGEPRGKHKKGDPWEGRGHCIDCDSCVVVCPMGIDIREGLQYKCISCGLCVDACDSVMDKIELPRGLIRYDTESNQKARIDAKAAGRLHSDTTPKWVRPRTLYYAAILVVVGAVMVSAVAMRAPTEVNVIHNRSPQFVRMSDGSVRNDFQIKVLNKTHEDRAYSLKVEGLDGARITSRAAGDVVVDTLQVPANTVGEFRAQVEVAPDSVLATSSGRNDITFVLTDASNGRKARHDSFFAH